MAKVRQPYEETRYVPWLGRDVPPGQVADVPETDLASYLEAGWEPADRSTQGKARKLRADGAVTVGGEPDEEPQAAPADEDEGA